MKLWRAAAGLRIREKSLRLWCALGWPRELLFDLFFESAQPP